MMVWTWFVATALAGWTPDDEPIDTAEPVSLEELDALDAPEPEPVPEPEPETAPDEAAAEPPETDDARPTADDEVEPLDVTPVREDGEPEYIEVLVIGMQQVKAARDQVVRSMEGLGWRGKTKRDGSIVFRPPEGWMGKARLLPTGDLEFGQPVWSYDGLRDDQGNATDQGKQLDGGLAGGTSGITTTPFPGKKKVSAYQNTVMAEVRDDLMDYRKKIQQRYFSDYIASLPERLDALWHDDVSLDGGDPVTDPAKKRAQVLAFWAGRTDTPEGRTVSRSVELWLREVVMESEHPVTRDEAAAAEARRLDGRPLGLF